MRRNGKGSASLFSSFVRKPLQWQGVIFSQIKNSTIHSICAFLCFRFFFLVYSSNAKVCGLLEVSDLKKLQYHTDSLVATLQ